MDNTPQTENAEPQTAAEERGEQFTRAAELAFEAAQHPAAGQPLRELAPLLVQLLESLAADVAQLKAELAQLKAEAYRAPCEGCGAAGEAHQQAQG